MAIFPRGGSDGWVPPIPDTVESRYQGFITDLDNAGTRAGEAVATIDAKADSAVVQATVAGDAAKEAIERAKESAQAAADALVESEAAKGAAAGALETAKGAVAHADDLNKQRVAVEEALRADVDKSLVMAESRNRTFFQVKRPSSPSEGDLWIRPNRQNELMRFDGTRWVTVRDEALVVADTRDVDSPPRHYYAQYPTALVRELKLRETLGIESSADRFVVISDIPWSGSSGGPVRQTAVAQGEVWTRWSKNMTVWGPWVNEPAEMKAGVEDARKRADRALQAADGKSTNYYGPTTPVGAVEGDTWFRVDEAGKTTILQRVRTDDGQLEWREAYSEQAVDEALASKVGSVDWRQKMGQLDSDLAAVGKTVAGVKSGLASARSDLARKISRGDVRATDIVAGAVTAGAIAANAVTADKLAAGSVTAGKIGAGAVTATEIAAGTITGRELAAGSVTADKLAAGSVTAGKVAAGSITSNELAAGSVQATHIGASAVTADKIAAGSLTAREIKAEMFTQVGSNLLPLIPGSTVGAWTDGAQSSGQDEVLVEAGGTFWVFGNYLHKPQNPQNLVAVDPNVDYDFSLWIKGPSGLRITLVDQDGEACVASGGINNPDAFRSPGEDGQPTQTGQGPVVNLPATPPDWTQFETRIRFTPSTRFVRVQTRKALDKGATVAVADLQLRVHIVPQAEIDAAQNEVLRVHSDLLEQQADINRIDTEMNRAQNDALDALAFATRSMQEGKVRLANVDNVSSTSPDFVQEGKSGDYVATGDWLATGVAIYQENDGLAMHQFSIPNVDGSRNVLDSWTQGGRATLIYQKSDSVLRIATLTYDKPQFLDNGGKYSIPGMEWVASQNTTIWVTATATWGHATIIASYTVRVTVNGSEATTLRSSGWVGGGPGVYPSRRRLQAKYDAIEVSKGDRVSVVASALTPTPVNRALDHVELQIKYVDSAKIE